MFRLPDYDDIVDNDDIFTDTPVQGNIVMQSKNTIKFLKTHNHPTRFINYFKDYRITKGAFYGKPKTQQTPEMDTYNLL